MQAFILAAGQGSRLYPLTQKLPKPLLPCNGKPLLWYTLAKLKAAEINQMVINLWYMGDIIKSFMEHHHNFGFDIYFSEEQDLMGTGGALVYAQKHLNKDFLLCNADIISNLNFNQLINHFGANKQQTTLALCPNGKPSVAVISQKIVDFSNLMKSGVRDNFAYFGQAVISEEIFDFLPEGCSSIVSKGFIPLVQSGRMGFYEHNGWWHDLGTLSSLRSAEIFLETKKQGTANFDCSELVLDQEYLDWLYRSLSEV